jgi:alpha-methylacyl-CoA racemase
MGDGPLAGRVILEMGGIGPAPFGAMLLAELGAEVIRIDAPESEKTRRLPLQDDLLNRGKKSLVLDLKRPGGVQAVLHLARTVDAFIEGFRPGVAERLGLGPNDLTAANPKIVYARMTGWGQTGPLAKSAGHDINYIALTGALHAIGSKASGPQIPLNLVGDFGGGSTYMVIGILAAMMQADATGKGQVIDTAIMDGTTHLMTYLYGLLNAGKWQDSRESNILDGGAPYYAIYSTADEKHVAVGCIEAKFFAEMIRLLDLPAGTIALERQNDPAYWPQLRQVLAAAFRSKTRDEWDAIFTGTDACVSAVLSMTEAPEAPQVAARGTLRRYGEGVVPGLAPRFSSFPDPIQRVGPLFGQHSIEILTQLGLPGEALVAEGIALQAKP